MIIDQPTGFRMRPGRGSPSSAGTGSFTGNSDKEWIWQVMRLSLLSLAGRAMQRKAPQHLCAPQGWLCIGSRQMAHQRKAGEQAGNREDDRAQHVEQRQPDLAPLIKQR